MIRNIILDMGNVLLDYNPEIILEKACDCEAAKKQIRKELFGGPEWIQGDLGQINDSERYELVKQRVEETYWPALKQCCMEWDICMKPIPGAKEFCLLAKESHYRLYVLSNASDRFYQYFERLLPLDFFDGIVVSADVHIIKPDPEIYRYLLKKYNLEAGECFFIDDREENVRAAVAVGMKGHVFIGSFDNIEL